MSALTEGAAPSEVGYVLCVGLPLAQVREVTAALQGTAVVLATSDTAGARALLAPTAADVASDLPPEATPVAATGGPIPHHAAAHPGVRRRPVAVPVLPAPRHLATNVTLTPTTRRAAGSRPVSPPPSAHLGTGMIPAVTGLPPAVPVPADPSPVLAMPVSALDRGPLHVDLATREVTAQGLRIHLSRREFDLLSALAFDAGRVWSFEELTHLVWRTGFLGDTDPVVSAVKRLRKRLMSVPGLEVASVRGVGYRLLVPT
ncbi:winged helix-turn-helix domain-containing protein [Xylanimonas sp. McL0601]|uniref:winged helix-turn-helix domain-containing protein n=1 Tax=Xylanimonas sp. McL0601 TaxID=3414739 RepID=UPI003CF3363B